jgi:hypothetical protein
MRAKNAPRPGGLAAKRQPSPEGLGHEGKMIGALPPNLTSGKLRRSAIMSNEIKSRNRPIR